MPFQSVLPFFSSKCVGENSLIHRRQAGRQTDRQTDVQLLSTVFRKHGFFSSSLFYLNINFGIAPVLEDHWLHRSKAKAGKRMLLAPLAAACYVLLSRYAKKTSDYSS
jgi:hypothetical protein